VAERIRRKPFSWPVAKAEALLDVRRRRGTTAVLVECVASLRRAVTLLTGGLGRADRPAPSEARFWISLAAAGLPDDLRAKTLASLRRQSHRRWRLVDDVDTAGPGASSPDLVVLVTAGDVLHRDALAWLAATADRTPEADVFYTDEEQAQAPHNWYEPFIKPDWAPELLLSQPYVLHCCCIRHDLFRSEAGLRSPSDEAGHYGLALRCCAAARCVSHVRRVLCRTTALSALQSDAGLRAVAMTAECLDPPAEAAHGMTAGTYRITRSLTGRPPVTLAVLTRDAIAAVEGRGTIPVLPNFLASILERSTYPDYRLLVVDDGDLSRASLDVVALAGARRVSYVPQTAAAPFNFSSKVGFAIGQVETEHFVLLNDDLEVIAPDWIEALMDYAVAPDVGAVGAHLLFPDGRTQHAGVVAAGRDGPAHRLYGSRPGAKDEHGRADVVRDFSAVTAAVMASRLGVFRKIGGFDEAFARSYNDVDFCLRARKHGLRIVYTPFARLYHFENSSFGRRPPDRRELQLFHRRWGRWCLDDPYYVRR
jgi:GT2 family glycosyltransferase